MGDLFKVAKQEMAFLKMGIYGEAGSGKTFTSTLVAIGLWMHLVSQKLVKKSQPIAFLDTETGSDFVKGRFEDAKVKLVVAKSRAFQDLLNAVKTCVAENIPILLIDSITHFWNELLKAYVSANSIKRITLQHWGPIKQTWAEFTDIFVNSPVHIIMCGRAGYIWEDVEDETGAKELKKTGTKMKAETEMGYEPSILIEMTKERSTGSRKGIPWVHRANVVKDRFDVIDGKHFDDPGFKEFWPHIALLNLGGEHHGFDEERTSESMFEKGESQAQRFKKKEQVLEKIQNEIWLLYPGQTAEHKKSRMLLMKKIFNTHSWNEICDTRDLDVLEKGLHQIEDESKSANKEDSSETAKS